MQSGILFTMQATRTPYRAAKRKKRRYSFFEEVMKGVEVEEVVTLVSEFLFYYKE